VTHFAQAFITPLAFSAHSTPVLLNHPYHSHHPKPLNQLTFLGPQDQYSRLDVKVPLSLRSARDNNELPQGSSKLDRVFNETALNDPNTFNSTLFKADNETNPLLDNPLIRSSDDGESPSTELKPKPKRNDLHFAASSAAAAGIAAATTYPLSAAISRGIANDMNIPKLEDITHRGVPTTATRAIVQTGLIEFIRPSVRNSALKMLNKLPGTKHLEAPKAKVASEILALLATSFIVTLITAPIENLAMAQNKSGKALGAVLHEMLKNNPKSLFSSFSSALVSMNLAWSLRLYARLKSDGCLNKEQAISTRLASYNSPIRNFLRCVNSRQMVHGEKLLMAILGTVKTMASRPINTLALIGLNILIRAQLGTRIYHGTRRGLLENISPSLFNFKNKTDGSINAEDGSATLSDSKK